MWPGPVLVHKATMPVTLLPDSDLPSPYNHALWWTLEDMWEVVDSALVGGVYALWYRDVEGIDSGLS
jgi:hypothetical protein